MSLIDFLFALGLVIVAAGVCYVIGLVLTAIAWALYAAYVFLSLLLRRR